MIKLNSPISSLQDLLAKLEKEVPNSKARVVIELDRIIIDFTHLANRYDSERDLTYRYSFALCKLQHIDLERELEHAYLAIKFHFIDKVKTNDVKSSNYNR